ncbi:hypothetical protein COY27_02530 [Candidatus Woesearchaeota archaeon CG_4_10_14_0_2_um_filter_33_13]|nr:MAG: hypothetical protein COY27_02530 [Candidatus Woesearchaeota archaeon CG_4_10_14_0_2_um_filter_33_13]
MWLKRYQIENVVPLLFTIISTYFVSAYRNYRYYNYVGIGFMVIGLLIWWIGKLNLDDAFHSGIKPKRLVQTGIYSKIRHPIYIGLVLTLFGWSVYLLSIMWLGVTISTLFVMILRAYKEERALFRKYGKRFIAYKLKTWF